MKYSSLFSTITLLGLVACNSGSKSGGGSSSTNSVNSESHTTTVHKPEVVANELAVEVERKTKFETNFSNFEAFKADINTYRVNFISKSGDYSNAKVVCTKSIFDRVTEPVVGEFDPRGKRTSVLITLDTRDLEIAEYDCEVFRDGQVLESSHLKLKKSVVISKDVDAFSIGLNIGQDLESLVIDRSGKLVTNGKSLNLKINDLISENGVITTFIESDVENTPNNMSGRNGGSIGLEIEKAYGFLLVDLRGTNGGKVTTVPTKKTSIPPADPRLNGKCTYSNMSAERCSGKKGYPGEDGDKGDPGFIGGNTGRLDMVVANETDLKIKVNFWVGKGSEGGEGGEGGLGGPGGKGVTIEEHEPVGPHCPQCSSMKGMMSTYKFPNGPRGDNGKKGEKGIDGSNGDREQSSVSIAGRMAIFDQTWKNY